MATYTEAKANRDALSAEVDRLSALLNAFPKAGPLRLTPDDVKSSPEFRMTKSFYDAAFAQLRKVNSEFTKTRAKEIRDERRNRVPA